MNIQDSLSSRRDHDWEQLTLHGMNNFDET